MKTRRSRQLQQDFSALSAKYNRHHTLFEPEGTRVALRNVGSAHARIEKIGLRFAGDWIDAPSQTVSRVRYLLPNARAQLDIPPGFANLAGLVAFFGRSAGVSLRLVGAASRRGRACGTLAPSGLETRGRERRHVALCREAYRP